jgi:hypothetical protein
MLLKQNSGHSGDKVWESPSPGVYSGVCIDVVDKGWVQTEYQGESKEQHKVRLVWELDCKTSAGENMVAGRTVTFSMGKNAKLRELLSSWRGRDFTAQELGEGFDLERVIGAQAQIVINEFKTKEGDNRSFVDNVLRADEDVTLSANADYKRMRDRDDWVEPGSESAVDDTEVPF